MPNRMTFSPRQEGVIRLVRAKLLADDGNASEGRNRLENQYLQQGARMPEGGDVVWRKRFPLRL